MGNTLHQVRVASALDRLVVADNTEMDDARPYLEHVRDLANGYVSVNFPVRESDGMEISCFAAD